MTDEPAGAPIAFVTPCFEGDRARFEFQRESMHRCGIEVPHLCIVDTEDAHLFRPMPYDEGLTVVTSGDVLPGEIEDRRRRAKEGRRPRRGRRAISGWSAQQLLKLAAGEVLTTDYVCVDSDNFWVRPVSSTDFRAPDGRLHLAEYHYLTTEIVQWTADSLRFLGVPSSEPVVPVSYVHEVIPFAIHLVRDLHRHIEERYERPWAEAMAEHEVIEYSTYGVYARYIRGLDGVAPAAPDHCMGYWTEEAAARFDDHFPEAVARGGAKAGMVHSRLGIDPSQYRSTVESVWADLGRS